MIDELIQNQSTTMITAALLGLRKHQSNKVAFEARGMTPRVTPEVLLWLTVYQYHRQQYIKAYAKMVWYQTQVRLRQKEVAAIIEKGEQVTTDDLAKAKIIQEEVRQLVVLLSKEAK